MICHRYMAFGNVLGFFLFFSFSSTLWADGGAVRLHEQRRDYQITVFTSPTPLRAGLVDISVLVQDTVTGECVRDAQVTIRPTRRGAEVTLEYPATAEAATNKLFYAAVFRLPEAGWWDVEVAVEGPHGLARVLFEVEAAEPSPRWLDLWPWFGWPILPVALFGIHQILLWRTASSSSRIKRHYRKSAARLTSNSQRPPMNFGTL